MPLTYSIGEGIACGFLSYLVLMVFKGKAKKVHPVMYFLAILFINIFCNKINGENIIELGKDFRNILGYMLQQQGIYKSFTGRRFLWYMASLKGWPKKQRKN